MFKIKMHLNQVTIPFLWYDGLVSTFCVVILIIIIIIIKCHTLCMQLVLRVFWFIQKRELVITKRLKERARERERRSSKEKIAYTYHIRARVLFCVVYHMMKFKLMSEGLFFPAFSFFVWFMIYLWWKIIITRT